jgi:C1A family cysteine protease
MKKIFTLLLTAILISFLFASMPGGSSASATLWSSAGARWEASVKLQPEAARLAFQDRSTLTDTMRRVDVSAGLQDGWLSMQGQKDMTQISTALFDTASPWLDFLGGVVEMTIHLPSDGKPVTLNLEARNTTGYIWEILPGEGVFVMNGNPTISMRYRGRGVPSIQSFHLSATRTGDATIHLLYHRKWEAMTEAHAQVNIWLTSAANLIELSDPTPAFIPGKESTNDTGSDPYAVLNQIKTALPPHFDWRDQGILPAVRDQGQCGSCWAFGTVGVMESAIVKGGGPMTDLSEQFLVSCNTDGWDCGGGWTATKYHFDTLGVSQTVAGAVLETEKPYTATNGTCSVAYNHPYKASCWQFIVPSEISMPTVMQIKNAIYTYGPITAGVCADSGWDFYPGGVYDPLSNECFGGTNHQIDLVGWDDATTSWILRNSWGSSWGESGYMRIRWDTTGTTSRVGEGTSWVQYGSLGFNSSFNGSSTGWKPVKGTWSIYNSAYYKSVGLASNSASIRHDGMYGNFTYEVSMKRTGPCTDCANRIILRGTPNKLDATNLWKPSYMFQYENNGKFSVYEITSTGSSIALKGWTASAAIIPNGWNTLKVTANGKALRFYINNTLVWSGSDSTLKCGQVGVGFFRDDTAGTLYVNWAVLNPLSSDETPIFDSEVVAPGVETPGGTINMAP